MSTVKLTQRKSRNGCDQRQLDTLRSHETTRAANDPDFRYLVSDVAAIKELNAQKTVSLNLKTRQAENKSIEQGRLARENTRRAALGIAPLTSADQLESAELPEKILLQGNRLTAIGDNVSDRPISSEISASWRTTPFTDGGCPQTR